MEERLALRAIYSDMEKLRHGLQALKEAGISDYEAYGPVNLAELERFMPTKGSSVRIWSYVGAIVGLISFFYMCIWTSLIYNLTTGGKPPVSNVPFLVVSYEGTILIGSIAAFIAALALARLRPRRLPREYDPRFSGTDYGIVARVSPSERDRVMNTLKESGAAEINELN